MSTTTTSPAPAVKPRGECARCNLSYALTKSGRLGHRHGITPSGFSTGRRCPGVGLPPFFAVGA
ncbi:hypothetical protein [Streptomyces sp. A1136]|uniref:hypothetical protein n=1 Tax=Streptomyces sp. A1136 TaxID=2563102 RepID=UPI00109E8B3D|nr:hypothetical protein [Streptomyces sp. A1136]THA54286.1 hypothetical protein E6R62_17150 [Streptomyces sp. A1136]